MGLTDAARRLDSPFVDGQWFGILGYRSWSPSKDWVAGAAFDFRIHRQFSLEVDAMYRELNATWAAVELDGALNSVSPAPVVTFEFPVLAKYRFTGEKLRPFVEAGPAFRTTGNENFYPSHYGVAAGVGLETAWHGFRFAPVLRYTRWAKDRLPSNQAQSQPNQLELLLGISRASETGLSPLGRRVSFGVTAGWGLTPDVPSSAIQFRYYNAISPGSTDFVDYTEYVTGVLNPMVGPSLQMHLWRGLAFEAEALYKPLRTNVRVTQNDNGAVLNSGTYNAGSTWRFPVLAKYRFRTDGLRPFVEAGPSFRLATAGLSTYGINGGVGVEFRRGPFHIAPGVRYTHWSETEALGTHYARNEVVILTSVYFGGPARN